MQMVLQSPRELSSWRAFFRFLTVIAAAALFAMPAAADGEKIKVTVVVILAREDGDTIHPSLKQIAEEIQKRDPQLKSFRLQSMTSRDLVANQKSGFPLPDSKFVDVIVKHGSDDSNKVGIVVIPPDQGEIEYRTVCGKFLPIVTRQQTKNRERLILAVRVEPCQKK